MSVVKEDMLDKGSMQEIGWDVGIHGDPYENTWKRREYKKKIK